MEFLALKKEILDEVILKIIREDTITRVRAHLHPYFFSYKFLAVHDSHHGWS